MAHPIKSTSNPLINNTVFLNWNANGLQNKRSTFIEFLERHNVNIACICETHFVPHKPFKIPGYTIYRQDRDCAIASGGTAIFIKKNIQHHQILIPTLSTLEAVAIKITFNNTDLIIVSAYLQPNKRIQYSDLQNISSFGCPVLILGDLNSKNTIWKCRVSNPNGKRLHQITTDLSINISAPDEPTFYPTRADHRPDILDVVLFKDFYSPIFQNVLSELDSDHCPVIISSDITHLKKGDTPRLIPINGKVNWELFQSKLEEKLIIPDSLATSNDIDLHAEHLLAFITNCIKSSTKINHNYSIKPFFKLLPQDILKLIQDKHSTRRLWQRTRLPEYKRRLNFLTRKVKNKLDELRYSSYQEYLSEINPGDPNMWRATKRVLKSTTIIPPLKQNNFIFCSDDEKANILADHFEKQFTLQDSMNDINDEIINSINYNVIPTVEKPINYTTQQEIKYFINNLPNKKAPGYDLITNIILKNLPNSAILALTNIFNRCLDLGHFPQTWKHALIMPISKPGKNKTSPGSYRPISLLSTISKLFEKVIQKRLSLFINKNNIIPKFQYGFRAKHSTIHQLSRLTQIIEKGFETKSHTLGVFLDISAAFDKVWQNGLLFKLYTIGTPMYILKTISSFLFQRTFQVRLNKALSTKRNIKSGVPQGSILSPILYNIFIHDFPSTNSTVAMFADDTALLNQNVDPILAKVRLQNDLEIVYNWMKKWKLSLNVNKSQAKVFTLTQIQDPPELNINNTNIPWNPKDSSIKYLGVNLDKKLNWKIHINTKIAQAHARLALLYPLINRKSKLKTKCTLLIYKSILRPLLTYGCQVWGTASQTHLKKIQTFQNKILRISVNAPWFIRNVHLHKDLEMQTINEFIKNINTKYFNKALLSEFETINNIFEILPRARRLKRRRIENWLD